MYYKTIIIGNHTIVINIEEDNNEMEIFKAYENGKEVGENHILDELINDLRDDYNN